MNRSLLDTDIVSEISKARDADLVKKAEAYLSEHGRFSISAITVMEVVRGYYHAGKISRLNQFLSSLAGQEVAPFTRTTAELAGRIDADLLKSGQPIGRADPMIAATAIEQGLILVTGNTEHFVRIQSLGYELAIENWRG